MQSPQLPTKILVELGEERKTLRKVLVLMDEQLWPLPVFQKAPLVLQEKRVSDVEPGTTRRSVLPRSR